MEQAELIIVALLAIAVLAGFARALDLPYPIVLLAGGLAVALIPGGPTARVDPDLVFFVFLPPLLYSAAFHAPNFELRHYARPILLHAVGLVLVTVAIVAAVGHLIAGLPWGPAFVLGAVLAPTDPIAAVSILRRLGAPRRIAIILESDGMINDGSALVIFKMALAAIGATGFSVVPVLLDGLWSIVAGVTIGLAAGWLSTEIRRRFDEASIEITVSLLTPFAAYIPAERLGASGILAVVAAGLIVGRREMTIFSAETRLSYYAFWETLTFLLNSMLFLLIGLELRTVLDGISSIPATDLVVYAFAIGLAVLGTRMVWEFTVGALLDSGPRSPISLGWRERLVLGWGGMRGGVSLAAALSIPLVAGGEAFPDRDLVIFLAFTTILLTLLPSGLTLGRLITKLDLAADEPGTEVIDELRAATAAAALSRLDRISLEGGAPPAAVRAVRDVYEARLRQLGDGDGSGEPGVEDYDRVRSAAIAAEREALRSLRSQRRSDEAIRAIERELDLEEARLHARLRSGPVRSDRVGRER